MTGKKANIEKGLTSEDLRFIQASLDHLRWILGAVHLQIGCYVEIRDQNAKLNNMAAKVGRLAEVLKEQENGS